MAKSTMTMWSVPMLQGGAEGTCVRSEAAITRCDGILTSEIVRCIIVYECIIVHEWQS
jgi:hypothetical protein